IEKPQKAYSVAGEKLECLPYIVHDFDTKMESKCALVQNKKPVDNYVDTSRNSLSYPQGGRSGALRASVRITARHQEVFHLSRAHRGQHLQVILLQGLLLRVLVRRSEERRVGKGGRSGGAGEGGREKSKSKGDGER